MRWMAIWGCCLLFFAGCKDQYYPVSPLNQSLLELKPGDEFVYQVDSIHYNDFNNKIDTFRFQVHELIDSVLDSTNQVFKIRSFLESYDSIQKTWLPFATNEYQFHPSSVRCTEENNQFIRLITPVFEGRSWKGNALTNNEPFNSDWDYQYQDVWLTKKTGSLTFDSTVTIQWVKSSDLISEREGYDIYANHIGKIQRYFKNLEFDGNTGKVSGYVVHWNLIHWKK